jgi:hypothetical protein
MAAAAKTEKAPEFSAETLALCDWLVDNITLSAQAEDFESQAKRIATAKREIAAVIHASGGTTLADQRKAAENG